MDSVFKVLIVYFVWLSFNFYFDIYLNFLSYVNFFHLCSISKFEYV